MNATAWRSPASLRGGAAPSAAAGDLVRAGADLHPNYRIVALGEDSAWVRDLRHGTDHFVPIDRPPPPQIQESPCN